MLCPVTLSHDWQMGSVPLVTTVSDSRNLLTCVAFGAAILLAYRGLTDLEVVMIQIFFIFYISIK